jgi:hypothetical protein
VQILHIAAHREYQHEALHTSPQRTPKRGKLSTRQPPDCSVEEVAMAHKRPDVRFALVATRKVKELLTDVVEGMPTRDTVVRCVDALVVRQLLTDLFSCAPDWRSVSCHCHRMLPARGLSCCLFATSYRGRSQTWPDMVVGSSVRALQDWPLLLAR